MTLLSGVYAIDFGAKFSLRDLSISIDVSSLKSFHPPRYDNTSTGFNNRLPGTQLNTALAMIERISCGFLCRSRADLRVRCLRVILPPRRPFRQR